MTRLHRRVNPLSSQREKFAASGNTRVSQRSSNSASRAGRLRHRPPSENAAALARSVDHLARCERLRSVVGSTADNAAGRWDPRRRRASRGTAASKRAGVLVLRRFQHRLAAPISTMRPARITATSSAMYSTTPMLCVMNRYDTPSVALQLSQQVEDLRLHRDVERRGRLVADDQLRLHRQRARDGDALALAAGELVRIALAAHRGAGRPGRSARRCARGAPAASMSGRSASSPSSRMSNTRMRGFSDANGSWKMIWMSRRAALQRVAVAASNRLLPVEQRAGLRSRAWRRSSCTMALPVVVLPQPDSPTSASVRAGADRRTRRRRRPSKMAVRALQQAAADREAHAQVLDVEQRRAPARIRARRRRGSAGIAGSRGRCGVGSAPGVVEQAAHRCVPPARRTAAGRRVRAVRHRRGRSAARSGSRRSRCVSGGTVPRDRRQRLRRACRASGSARSSACAYGCFGRAKNSSAGATSMIWPAYISATRCAMPDDHRRGRA